MWDESYIKELESRRQRSIAAGGAERIKKQYQKGKLTARERIELLFDAGTFTEIGMLAQTQREDFDLQKKVVPGDGVVTGFGLVNGRMVCASSEDFTVMGGTLGEMHSAKICKALDLALEMKVPFIFINDSGGARIEEGISSLNGYSELFFKNTKASGIIPQIAVILGPCAGGACYSPAICDFVFMSEKASRMFITGPGVVKEVLGEEVTDESLGNAKVHSEVSGVAHFVYPTDEQCIDGVKKLLSYLPQSNTATLPVKEVSDISDRSDELQEVVPDNQRKIYDVHKVIERISDAGSFFEIQKEFGKSAVVGLTRISGEVIGVVANQPEHLGGTLDIDASEKAARFVRFCDCFRIPLLTLVDVPGFMPGMQQEHKGIIRRGAKLLYAYAEATVPKISLIMRKAYGGAYIAMNSKGLGADIVFAWPIAQIAVMGAEGAVDIIFHKQIANAEDSVKEREKLIQMYNDKFMSPYIAAERGYIDEVILPEETRRKIRSAFEALKNKSLPIVEKRHGNIPL